MDVRGKFTSYENFVVDCPSCGKENIFNRASDLGTFEPIGGSDVSCLIPECGKAFRIIGDSVNEAYEMLLFDTYMLRDQKQYMMCILNIAQAYEVFFSLFFRVELLYKPCYADSGRDLTRLNQLSEGLQSKIKNHAFCSMRKLFLCHLVSGSKPANLMESDEIIDNWPKMPNEPKDRMIDELDNPKLVTFLRAIKATKILTLRNDVIHKRAYRPMLAEVNDALDEAMEILLPLGTHLNLHDEINWYSSER